MQFSDFMLLPLLPKKGPLKIMDRIERLSIAFLNATEDNPFDIKKLLEEARIERQEMVVNVIKGKKNKYGEPKRDLEGKLGDVIYHTD